MISMLHAARSMAGRARPSWRRPPTIGPSLEPITRAVIELIRVMGTIAGLRVLRVHLGPSLCSFLMLTRLDCSGTRG